MITVFEGSLEACIKYVKKEEEKDDTLVFDIEQSEISDTLYYVYELDSYDAYQGADPF